MSATAVPESTSPTVRRARLRRFRFSTTWLLWIAVVLIMLFCLFPFYWLINTSLKTGADLSSANLVPPHPNLDNYSSIFHNGDFTDALRNSAVLSLTTTLIALVVGSFAAYALARLRVPMKFLLLAVILSITTFPPIAVAAPVYKLWTDIGLYDKPLSLGLILPDLTFTLPLTIYILTSFFRQIPRELEEAALVDGATYFQTFRKVVLPLAIYILTSFFKEIPKDLEEAALVDGATHFQAFRKVVVPLAAPGLATAGILTFIAAWNEFLLATTLTSSKSARTVPAAIAFFTGSTEFEQPLGTISAASVVISIPLIILVLLFQKRIVAGLTAGAVKG